ncbi:hypothetical protein [Longispora albida]|uniref:hypothetical protein n=1 Tax=Longispora albida TaxID=203523 RepID=UPI0012F87BA9|nr:hypothetical protein [Longispora albida]
MLDFSPTGWIALYEPTDPNRDQIMPVESWSADGLPQVVHGNRLVSADTVDGFVRLERVSRVAVAFAAAPGWKIRIWENTEDDASAFTEPIAAWIVDDGGALQAVPGGTNDGYLEPFEGRRRAKILPPDGPAGEVGERLASLESLAFRTGNHLAFTDEQIAGLSAEIKHLSAGAERAGRADGR